MTVEHSFTKDEMKAFEPAEKIGLVACVNPDGQIHLTLITSIMACRPDQLTLGQFCMGLSKRYMQMNPQVGFLIMTLDRRLWRGKARWTHKKTQGPEYEIYNDIPMFRYNAYFGINTVHYLDLVETHGEEKLPMAKIIPAAVTTKLAKGAAATNREQPILKPFAESLFNQPDALKFIAYLGNDGFPVIIPAIQCQASDSRRIVFWSNRNLVKQIYVMDAQTGKLQATFQHHAAVTCLAYSPDGQQIVTGSKGTLRIWAVP